MQCKSLWIKASAKCINVNVNVTELAGIMALEDDATDGSSLFNRVTSSGCTLHTSMMTVSITELQTASNN